MGLMSGVGLLVCALVVWRVTEGAATGAVGRHGLIGIRTKGTQVSDESWAAGHRAAAPVARRLAVVCSLFAVSKIVVGVVQGPGDPSPAVIVLFSLGYGWLLVGGLRLAKVADRAGRSTLS